MSRNRGLQLLHGTTTTSIRWPIHVIFVFVRFLASKFTTKWHSRPSYRVRTYSYHHKIHGVGDDQRAVNPVGRVIRSNVAQAGSSPFRHHVPASPSIWGASAGGGEGGLCALLVLSCSSTDRRWAQPLCQIFEHEGCCTKTVISSAIVPTAVS